MGKLLRLIWRFLAGISHFISVVVPLLLLGLFFVFISRGVEQTTPDRIPDGSALVLNPGGFIVEDRTSKDAVEALLAEPETREVLLADLVRAVHAAADDERLGALVVDLQNLRGLSTSQAMELAAAVEDFKSSGKPVIAVGDYYSQQQYLLAAQSDHVLLHPMGAVMVQGFGVYRSYLREFLDNVMVNMHVFRVGENKSAVEPYLRDDMSEVEREVVSRWIGGLWDDYTRTVEAGRGMAAGSLDALIANYPDRLDASGGDMAQLALDAGLVDQLTNHTESEAFIAELLGEDDGEYIGVGVDAYLYSLNFAEQTALQSTASGDVIAVVPIEGEIIPGDSSQGMVGSDSVVAQLERAENINNLGAIVLRVNSPGGSVFASEVMRRKILEIKAEGVPVVVSMASVAASGGYYIAADADRIIAQPTTITGSIGVFAAFPTFEGVLDYAGIHTDGVGTTPLAGSGRIDRPLDEATRRIFTSSVNDIYNDFIGLVAEGRDLPEATVREIAEGKVWTGRDALEIGLVDELGTLDDATAAAAELAGLEDWQVRRVGTPISQEQIFFEELGRKLGMARVTESPLLTQLVRILGEPLAVLNSLRDPRQIYVRCLSCSSGL